MAGLRRTDVIKLVSPVETGLVRFNPARRANPVRSGLTHPRPVQSWYTDVVKTGFDLTDSVTSGHDQSKPVQSGLGHSPPVQSGLGHARLVQSGLGLADSNISGLRGSRAPVQTKLRSPAASGTKRPVKRSSVIEGSTTEGAPTAAKRRKTGLNHTGLHSARKLVTSLFGWKGPETEVGNDTRCHDFHEKRTTGGVPTSAKDNFRNNETRHLASEKNSDINDLTKQLDLLNFKEKKLCQNSNYLSNGRKQFNMDPKKGMEYLIEHRVVENTPHDVATFMYTAQGLSKTAIGEYLGERHAFNQEALKAFVNLQEFSQTNLVQALRQFLWSFRLPGEAQKIDRMMEQFADRYCQLNPGVFSSTDACYILCFALIMLNTSLHNPNVKDKLTSDAFVAMNRGLQADQEMPRQLLLDLYGSIKREPLKIPEDEKEDLMFTFFNPVREGWLYKRGGRCKTWKRRWFILNDGCLYYFQFTTDKEPKGIVPLENIEIRDVADRTKPNCFELYSPATDHLKACKTDSFGRVVEGNHKVFRISASTPEEQEGWMRSIRSAVSDNPIYDLIYKRRRRSRLPASE